MVKMQFLVSGGSAQKYWGLWSLEAHYRYHRISLILCPCARYIGISGMWWPSTEIMGSLILGVPMEESWDSSTSPKIFYLRKQNTNDKQEIGLTSVIRQNIQFMEGDGFFNILHAVPLPDVGGQQVPLHNHFLQGHFNALTDDEVIILCM